MKKFLIKLIPLVAILFSAVAGVAIVCIVEGSNPHPGEIYSYTEDNPFQKEKHRIQVLRVEPDDNGKLWVEYSHLDGDSVLPYKNYMKWSRLKEAYPVKEVK